MIDFLELIKIRKSVRSFTEEAVPHDLVEKVIEAATYAPTNCNQQLWNFIVVEDSKVKERLIKEAASNTLIRRTPTIIVVTYDGWNYKEAIQGASLAVGHMLLAATSLGLGSLPMNSYGADTKIKKILNIPLNQTICCFVLLGFVDERGKLAPIVPRRDYREIVHWGKFFKRKDISYKYDPETWSKDDLIRHQTYFSRKTFLGKEMDIMAEYERRLVNKVLAGLNGSVTDYCSYDGAYLREFPKEVRLTTVDLCDETALYSSSAAELAGRTVHTAVLGKSKTSDKKSTLIFKLERMPKELREEVYKDVNGDFIIIARKQNIFLSLFFFITKLIFGPDVRKTGVFTFFGPYKPVSVRKVTKELERNGFRDIKWHGYFAFPAFYELLYQMFLQYRASEGSSYLHRERRSDFITKLISWILKVQGLRQFGALGSVVVIQCRK